MNAKFGADGQPDVIYLQDVFDGWLGKDKARVILPITDPYVVHHGALGSFAVVYLPSGTTAEAMAARLKSMPGIEAALSKEEAAQSFRAAGRSAGRSRRRLDQAQGAGHLGGAPRSVGPHRAVAQPWRRLRAEGAAALQSQALPPIRRRAIGATSTPSISPSTSSPERDAHGHLDPPHHRGAARDAAHRRQEGRDRRPPRSALPVGQSPGRHPCRAPRPSWSPRPSGSPTPTSPS